MDQNQTPNGQNLGQGAAQAAQQAAQGAQQAAQGAQQAAQGAAQAGQQFAQGTQQYQYQYQQYQQGGPQYQQQYNQGPQKPNEFQKTVNEVKGAFKDGKGMYSNVGNKLCVIAKIVFWIGVVYHAINCILGIVGSVSPGGLFGIGASVNGVGIVSALISAAVGVFIYWIASLCIYGFGQIVTKITGDKKD